MSDLKKIMDKAHQLPPLSPSSMRLMEIVGNEDHSMQDIVKIVESDAILTFQVLKTVNSASFGLRAPISTVSRAVSFLGEKMIIGIAVGSGAPHVFNKSLDGYESKQGELWAHGLRTAIASQNLALLSKKPVAPDEAFTAGILHDIGKTILSEFLVGSSHQIIETVEKGEAEDFLAAEGAILGTDHCAVGGELANHWNLPQDLQSVIRHHHRPKDADEEHQPLTFVVHMGDAVSMMGGTATGADAMLYHLDDAVTDFIRVSSTEMEKVMMNVMIEFEKIRESLFGDEPEEEA